MALTVGQHVGSYEILGPLGAGGMGQVYRARDAKLKREVALKILPDHFAQDAERLIRFQREAEALAAINHPNIAVIFGLEEADGTRALVLELVEGQTLAQRLEAGPLGLDDGLAIARQLAEALEAAHAKGIVHRDLKPANIKITADGKVKVLDFGLAKIFTAVADAPDFSRSPTVLGTMSGSAAGVILGTAAYMSPEQARGKAVDARSDVWAFGCVLYEMLTGRPVFAGETITDILGEIVKSDPDWAALPRETTPPIRRLLRRCLVKDPTQRLHAMADARLEIAEARSEPVAGAAPVNASPTRGRAMGVVAGAAIAAAVAMTVPTVRYFRTPPMMEADAPELRLQVITPPTTDPISMALSPDGRRLTFVATSDGTPRLWLRPLDTVTAQPLPGTDGASYPFWSPDSRAVGFFAEGKLKRIDIGGGQPQIIANAAGSRGGAWNGDGVILFGKASAGLLRVPASGGEVIGVTRPAPSQTNHRFPQFLPDGRHFLYFSQGSTETQGVHLGSLDSSDTVRLTPSDTAAAYMLPGYVLYTRQGSLVARRFDASGGALAGDSVTVADPVGWDGAIGIGAFSVSANGVVAYRTSGPGRRQLTWFDRAGKAAGVVGAPDGNSLQYPVLSRDGHRVAIDRTVLNNRDVFIADLARGEPTRFTFDADIDATPIWSPDGGRIVFRSSRKGVYDLYEKSASLEGSEALVYESPEAKTPSDWSPDGLALMYVNLDPNTGNDLWILPLNGTSKSDRKPFPFVQTPFDESQAAFSPDGHFVAYQSNEGGPMEIYVQPFPGPGGKRQISNAGGASPRWRRDGRELFFLSPDAKLMAVPIRVQGSTLEAGAPMPLFQTRLSGALGGIAGNIRPQYDVAADGRFLMSITTEETTAPITVILNWNPK